MEQSTLTILRYAKWKHYNSSGQKCPEEQVALVKNTEQAGIFDLATYCPECHRSLFLWKNKK